MAFEEPFWADQNNDTGGSTLTDLPVKQIYFEMNTHTSGTVYEQHQMSLMKALEPYIGSTMNSI